jgi:hypothetical protein
MTALNSLDGIKPSALRIYARLTLPVRGRVEREHLGKYDQVDTQRIAEQAGRITSRWAGSWLI